MKKKLITILLTLSIITLIGCGDATTTKAGDNKLLKLYEQDGGFNDETMVQVFADTDTGVEYIVTRTSHGTAITPRLDQEGKIMVETKYIKK